MNERGESIYLRRKSNWKIKSRLNDNDNVMNALNSFSFENVIERDHENQLWEIVFRLFRRDNPILKM